MKRMRRFNQSMLHGPLFPSIISYTIPIILTSLLQLLFNAADLVIVGRYRGSLSVAAVSATGALINLIINLFIGLSIGSGVSVAHALGGKQHEETHRIVHTALPTAVTGGLIVTVVGILFAEPLLRMMGTPENVLPLSALYMKIYFGGMVFTMVYNFCASILRAAGDSKSPLIFLALAGTVNVGLNVIFVTVFHMNVEGVALATVASQAISAVLVVRALMRRTDSCHLELKAIRFYKPQLLKMIRIGLPAGIQSSLFSISNVIIQSSINSFGDILMSGNGAAGSIEGFLYVTFNAFQQTSVNFIGQNAGAKQYKRAKNVLLICLACAITVTITLSALIYAFGPQLLSIYITDSQEAIQYGMIRFAYVTLPYFLCALMDVTTGGLRGLGASMTPMLISVLGVCGIRLVWIFTIFQIPAYHTPQSLYFSYPISWTFTFIAQLTAFMIIYRKRCRSVSPQ
jgi:putative MATE family efflux protein